MPAIATYYVSHSVVCPSVTFVHPVKTVGWNEMAFDRNTCVAPSRPNNVVRRGSRYNDRKGRLGG